MILVGKVINGKAHVKPADQPDRAYVPIWLYLRVTNLGKQVWKNGR